MKKLFNTKTYLIGPLENGDDVSCWRDLVKTELNKIGVTCFDPTVHPFVLDIDEGQQVKLKQLRELGSLNDLQERMKSIRRHDLSMVDKSDFIICYIDPEKPTWGTVDELVHAERMNKPIFMFVEGGKRKCPLWLFALVPLNYIYNSLDDILEKIQKIDNDEIEIDSKRWKLMRPEFR